MKKLFLLTLPVLLLSLLFIGCSNDDDNESSLNFDKTTAVGTWSITSVSGTSEWRWIAQGKELTFNSDGTCKTDFSMENAWKIEDGKIKTYYKPTAEPMLIYSLISTDGSIYNVRVNGTLDESDLSVVIKMKKLK